MARELVLTIIADDRPGLVEQIARTIADNSGNWLESSMSQLAGKFAGILRVAVSSENTDSLVAALESLQPVIRMHIESAKSDSASPRPETVRLSIMGNDRPGIVRDISRIFTARSVNYEEFSSACVPAPMSGDMLFKAEARVKLPGELSVEDLKQALETLADDIIVEFPDS